MSKLKTDSTSGCLVFIEIFIFNDKAMATIFEIAGNGYYPWGPTTVTIDPNFVVFNFCCRSKSLSLTVQS